MHLSKKLLFYHLQNALHSAENKERCGAISETIALALNMKVMEAGKKLHNVKTHPKCSITH